MTELNKPLIRSFWKRRSIEVSNRWTKDNFLNFENAYLTQRRPQSSKPIKILDLGSGSGELSKGLQKVGDTLVAVDFEENYSRFFMESEFQFFNPCDVTSFESNEKFDVILLYGVVTHLNEIEENKVYRKILNLLSLSGIAIIKHQVSLAGDLVINSYSDVLGQDYSARYPSHLTTEIKLNGLFREVEVLEYPNEFNTFNNTKHVAYFVWK